MNALLLTYKPDRVALFNKDLRKSRNAIIDLLNIATVKVKKNMDYLFRDVYKDITKTTIKEPFNSKFRHMLRGMLTDYVDIIEIAKRNVKRYTLGLQQYADNKDISILDRFNKIREGKLIAREKTSWRLDTYTDMYRRTNMRNMQSTVTVDMAERDGDDLIRVSNHNTETPICKRYEGKIFSLSGNSIRYPKLDKTPPYHANCLHVITIYDEAFA